MTDYHDPNLVDYAVGLLDASAIRATEAHLRVCPQCQQELRQLREVDTALRGLPPELFIDSPPHGSDLALQRAMRQVRDEKANPGPQGRRSGPRRTLLIAAAAIVLAVVGGGSWILGQQAGVTKVSGQALPADGTHVSASSPTTGAQLTAIITPATGWVRVTAHVTGIPPGEQCNLIVIDHAGAGHLAGSWLVSPNPQGATITGATVVAPTDVAAIAVQNVNGHEFVRAAV